MLKIDVELGECLYIHRKSRVHLLTQTVTSVLCKNADHHDLAASSQPYRLWLPRARAFLFSLSFYFADDVDLTPTVSQDATSIIAELIEGAEVRLTAS